MRRKVDFNLAIEFQPGSSDLLVESLIEDIATILIEELDVYIILVSSSHLCHQKISKWMKANE